MSAPYPEIREMRQPNPIALALSLALVVAVARAQITRPGVSAPRSPQAGVPSSSQNPVATIAVLPFENLKKDAQYDWLGIGAADTLTTKLAAVDALVVVERSQVQKVLQEQDFQKLDVT